MMKNSKLFTLLHTFDAKDWQQFGQYVRSPFFNQTGSLVALTQILEAWFKEMPQKNETISKQAIFKQVLPDEAFSAGEFHRLCSRLLALVTDFLAYQTWQEDGIMARYYSLQAFSDRKLDKHFRFAWQKTEVLLEQEPLRNIRFYQQKYWLSAIAEQQLLGDKGRIFGPQVQQAAEDFDHYLVTQKLRHLCSIASLNKLQPDSFQAHFAPQILLMANQLQHVPMIAAYRSLYLMLTEEDADRHFFHLKGFVLQHEQILAQKELNFIYLTLINFCIGRIRYGEKDYATPLLELYEKALGKGFLTDKGVISPWTFKNVVKLGLGLQRFDWVETFIHQYAPLLAEKERTEAMHFNLADLHYYQKDFAQAQLHLREVEFSDIRYYLHGHILLAKIYYATQAWESLDSLLASFKIYLMRSKKMPRDEKKPYLNFIRILEKLLQSFPNPQPKLRDTILQTPMLTDRTWLLKILDDL